MAVEAGAWVKGRPFAPDGADFDRAVDAWSALATDDGATFDLILSDVQMPGINNGIDVAEKVRRRWPKQTIALMTGYADEFERARNAGVTILSKPFNIDDLQTLLHSVAPVIR